MLPRDSRKRIYRLNKYTSECELNECYTSNDIFIEFINDGVQDGQCFVKTIEYGYLYNALAEYNANHMHPGNRFVSPISWNPAVYLNYCSWEIFQTIAAGRPITSTILLTGQPNIIRKVYSSLSNEQKLVVKKRYDMLTDPIRQHYHIRNIPVPYFTIAKYLLFHG